MTDDMKTDAEKVMKRCQIGTTNYEAANNLHAECYGTIGRLLAEVERLAHQRETKEGSARVGHLHIQRHPERGIWLSHDNNEAMQTDEDKFYQHLMDYWNKEF